MKISFFIALNKSLKQCFKTRSSPAGRPGTQAWNRARLKKKLARDLPWQNPKGRPGTRTIRVNPGETRLLHIYKTTSFLA